jgi:16S rRNA processing protein RimM
MEYFNIGKFVTVHGVKGELLLQHDLGKKSSLKGLQAVFIEEKSNSFLPWFIESTKIKSDTEIYCKLEGIDSREAALKLARKTVWITEADHQKFSARNAPRSLIGYSIVDQDRELGNVLEVIEQPQQVLCRLDIKGKEVLIPLHEDSLKKIDHKNKIIKVELPEGLLEIYLD